MINKFNEFKIAEDVRAKFFCLYTLIVNHEHVHKYKNSPVLIYVFDSLIDFIWVANIGEWYKKNNELRPWVILDDHPDALSNLEFISEKFHSEIKSIYVDLNDDWIKNFDDLYWYTFDCIVGDKIKSNQIFEELFYKLKGKKPC